MSCIENDFTIYTNRLNLRSFTLKDADAVYERVGNWNIARYTSHIPHPYEPEMAEQWLSNTIEDMKAGKSLMKAVVERRTGNLIGGIELDFEETPYEIGYWIAEDSWGKGYGSEIVKAFLGYVFGMTGAKEVSAYVHKENNASVNVLIKNGFTYNGTKIIFAPARNKEIDYNCFLCSKDNFINKNECLFVTAAVLCNKERKVLLAERPEGKNMAGLWEFAGGKVKSGETAKQSLVRELKEELSINVEEQKLETIGFSSYRYEKFHLMMPFYLCRKWEGEISPLEKQKTAWVLPDELNNYKMPPADRAFSSDISKYL